jgi:hypothetical protein
MSSSDQRKFGTWKFLADPSGPIQQESLIDDPNELIPDEQPKENIETKYAAFMKSRMPFLQVPRNCDEVL